MAAPAHPSPAPLAHDREKAITIALSLAQAERAIHAFTSGQVDAIVDPESKALTLCTLPGGLAAK